MQNAKFKMQTVNRRTNVSFAFYILPFAFRTASFTTPYSSLNAVAIGIRAARNAGNSPPTSPITSA